MFSQKKTVAIQDVNREKGLAVLKLFSIEGGVDLEIPNFFLPPFIFIVSFPFTILHFALMIIDFSYSCK